MMAAHDAIDDVIEVIRVTSTLLGVKAAAASSGDAGAAQPEAIGGRLLSMNSFVLFIDDFGMGRCRGPYELLALGIR